MFCFIAEAEEVAIRNIIACGQIGVAESSSSIHHHHHRIIKQNKKERIHIKIVDKVRCKMFVA